MKLKKKSIKKNKKNPSQYRLTFKSGIGITNKKQIKINYKIKFSINPMLKDEIEKNKKKEQKLVNEG